MRVNLKYTKEFLEEAVKDCYSMSSLLRKIGLKPSGGNHRQLSGRIRQHGVSTEHFTGQGWAKGKTAETSEAVRNTTSKISYPDAVVFSENSPLVGGPRLAKRLKRLGWEQRCSLCRITMWQGVPLTLHLDHINGVHNDNRLDNLRFLCPNCHQQTSTWGNTGGKQHKGKLQQQCNNCGCPHKNPKKYCRKCQSGYLLSHPRKRKLKFTVDKDTLKKEVEAGVSFTALAKKYGVSDNAIRKRCTSMGVAIPKRSKKLSVPE
jgi:transposase-like protein